MRSIISFVEFSNIEIGYLAYLISIIQMHNIALLCIDILMALTLSTHDQCSIHVHVMAGEIQTD